MIFIPAVFDELQKIGEAESLSGVLGLLPGKPSKKEVGLFNKLKKDSDTKVKIDPQAEEYGGGYFDPGNKSIGLGQKDYEALAHELGHAEIDKYTLGRLAQHPAFRWLFQEATVPTAIGAGALAGATGKSWGAVVPAAIAANTIALEMLATHIGKKKLEDIGVTEEQSGHYSKRLREGILSYLKTPAKAALAGVAAYGGVKLLNRLRH